MRTLSTAAAAILAATLLTGCGSSGIDLGSLGGILGSPSASQPSDVQATVQSVDAQNGRIDVTANYVNNLRTSNAQTQSIYFTSQTTVEYQGRAYRVTDLEQGDQISVRGVNDNGRYVAQAITVTRAR
jgi:Cu/Ag efflux protein CusF